MPDHKDIVGEDAVHPNAFYQDADPGAVGAGKFWWDTTADPPTYYRRNDADTNWDVIIDPAGGAAPTGTAGGDLGGTYPNPTVDALQGIPVSTTDPTSGQALVYNGSAWEPDDITATPSGAAGGVLSGTYPNPGFAVDMATQAELAAVEAAKADLASPVFTGSPQAPTASAGTSSTVIATTAFANAAAASSVGQKFTIGAVLGNGTDAITTAEKEYLIPIDSGSFNIVGWTIYGDASGSIVVKVESSPYAGYPSLTDLMTSERPTLSSAIAAEDTLTTPVAITTKCVLRLTVLSAATVTNVTIGFSCVRA